MKHAILTFIAASQAAGLMLVPASASAVNNFLLLTVHDGEYVIPNPHITIVVAGDTIRNVPVDWGNYYTDGTPPFWFGMPEEAITGTHVSETEPSPTRLFQNYPNPFNPTTTIEFSLEAPSHAALTIYSITGQRVRTLVDGKYGMGVYRIVWDGRDDDGRSVAAGLYFYRLVAGGTIATRKMLLLDGGGHRASGTAPVSDTFTATAKPADTAYLHCDIIVEKDGYYPYVARNAYIPLTGTHGNQAEVDIELVPEPGPMFTPYAPGDSLLYASFAGSVAWSDSVEYRYVRVLDEVNLNGQKYMHFSEWPLFVPEMFRDNEAPALIRINPDGKLIIRLFDYDILLYDLSGDEYEHSFNTNDMLQASFYYLHHEEKWNSIRGTTITTTLTTKAQVVTTPGGVYENCMLFTLTIDSWDGEDAAEDATYEVFYDRYAGFACMRYNGMYAPCDVLVGGAVNGKPVGAVPVVTGDMITGRDLALMVKQTFECQIGPAGCYHIGGSDMSPPGLVLSSEGVESAVPYLPDSVCDMPLLVMNNGEIAALAEVIGPFPVFSIRDIVSGDDEMSLIISYHLPAYSGRTGKDPYDMQYLIRFIRHHGYWVGITESMDILTATKGNWYAVSGDRRTPSTSLDTWYAIDADLVSGTISVTWDNGLACTTEAFYPVSNAIFPVKRDNWSVIIHDAYHLSLIANENEKLYKRTFLKMMGTTHAECF